jgi:hypothetical protein
MIHGVHRAFAGSRRTAGEAQDRNVPRNVEPHVVVRVGGRLDQVPEAADAFGQPRSGVHDHDYAVSAAQHLVVGRQHPRLDEHHFRPHVVDLPRVLLDAVAVVAEREHRLLLVDHRKMHKAEAVVIEDQQCRISGLQA